MTKYLVAFLTFAVIALGLYGWLATEQAKEARTEAALYKGSWEGEKRAREALQLSAKRTDKLLVERADKATDRSVTNKKVDREIKEATRANPVWADEPIPDGVRDALAAAGLVPKGQAPGLPPAPLP